jgi:DNA-binding HxlR family transcriptional regulator
MDDVDARGGSVMAHRRRGDDRLVTGFRYGEGGDRRGDDALRQAFAVLGKRWNGLIVAALADGPTGFTVLRRTVPGISERMLTDRLRELTDTGLAVREVETCTPARIRYTLTATGQALLPVLEALADWAACHLSDDRQSSPNDPFSRTANEGERP